MSQFLYLKRINLFFLIYEGSSQFGKEAQSKMDNSQEFLRKELANKYKDMEKKVEGFE